MSSISPSPVRHRALAFALVTSGVLLTTLVAGASVRAQDAEEASPAPVPSMEAGAASGIEGTWTVDTSRGDFSADSDSTTYVGFRVAEVLQQIGEAEAIGRTPLVSGSLEIIGSTLQAARIEADLTGIVSDRPRRDNRIQDALETREFPIATFESTAPVELGTLPAEGEIFSVTVPGVLTVHGVPKDVEVDMGVVQVGDAAAVVGSLPVDFTEFGISMPTAPVVLSVADEGSVEWQVFFLRDV